MALTEITSTLSTEESNIKLLAEIFKKKAESKDVDLRTDGEVVRDAIVNFLSKTLAEYAERQHRIELNAALEERKITMVAPTLNIVVG